MLPNPVHAERIIISRLHLLLLVDVACLSVSHLLSQDFRSSLTIRAIAGLHDAEVREAGDWLLLLDDIGLLSVRVWIVDGLRLGYHARLLVDDGWDLVVGC